MTKKRSKKKVKETFSKAVSVKDLFKTTTYNKGHNHRWMSRKGYTTTDGGHKHKINIKKMLAMPGGKDNHIHRLITKKKK